ncbi:MAG: TonB-dependent receptor [Bryobacterales bacterium]|nr:TonB-dependent receptor [Bryobacterales bacterium]
MKQILPIVILAALAAAQQPEPAAPPVRRDSIEVKAESSKVAETKVNAERNADRLNFDEDLMDALPAPGGNALAVATQFLAPAAQGAEGVTVTVDGIESSAAGLPASAIRRIRVNRNPYSLQFRRPGKARLEALSEEGSVKRFRGAVGLSLRNSVFDARNAFAPVRPDMNRALIDFNLSGPITRQRSSFYVNGEHYRNNEFAVVNARTLAGPFVANVAVPERRTRLLGRFETQGEQHQVISSYSYFDQSEENRNAGGLRLPEQGVPATERAHRVQISDRALLFNKILNDFRVVAQHEQTERGVISDLPTLHVNGAFTGGPGASYRQRRETSVRLQNLSTMTVGRHNLRFGAEARPAFYRSVERANFGGTFEFSGLDAFSDGRAQIYRINRGNPDLTQSQHEAAAFVQDEVTLAGRVNVTYGVRYGWQSDVRDTNNFAPRVGFAYNPGKGKTVIRGGAGVFHERISEDVNRRALLWNGTQVRESVYQNVDYPFTGGSLLTPPSVVRTLGLYAPVLTQASLGVERELHGRTTVAVEVQHLRGRNLLRTRNVNAPVDGLRPSAEFWNINQIESTAAMRSKGATVTLRTAAGKWFTGMVQYALSRTEDNSAGPFELPANSYDVSAEWGRSEYDQRHRVNAAAMAEMPKGWRLGGVLGLATGAPYTITTGRDDNGDSIVNDRPAGVGRNTGMGPGMARVDLRLSKAFRAPRFLDRGRKHSSRNVELSIDAFNLFNRVNFNNYVGVMSSPFYGRANSALAARTLQFSIRYKL